MASPVQSLLTQMALASDQVEADALASQLQEAIDVRLAELQQDNRTVCLSCLYPLTPAQQDICHCCAGLCPCENRWPPFNEYFRCEPQARLAWFAVEAALYQARPSERPFQPRRFPMDASPTPVFRPGDSVFDQLRRADLAAYAGKYTRLNQVGPGTWRGKCPLHKERTGSFYVYADPWRWRCYGACAMGGDILTLKRELRHLGEA